ncbi:MAG: hypothetical protein R3D67_17680 [Hyphomicrobiaceae bacterium]
MSDEITREQLAKLRIGMPQEELARIIGEGRMPRRDADKGFFFFHVYEPGAVGPKTPFIARIATDGTIASLGYYGDFEHTIDALGVSLGAPASDILQGQTDWQKDDAESSEQHHIEGWRRDLGQGAVAVVKVRDGRVLAVSMERVGAKYPGEMAPEAKMVRQNMRAYDMEMLHSFVDPASNQGWVFGLPPGITPQQWPLDPVSGYPLMHGFTLLLPEDYRVHGPEIVALSFFATAADQNDGGARNRADLAAAVLGQPAERGESADLKPFRNHAATSHPRLHRMTDILDYAYAVILLTAAEFNGAPCQPPQFAPNPYIDPQARPQWMKVGGGYACFWGTGGVGESSVPVEDRYIYKQLGAVPEQRLDWHRAIAWTPRLTDVNAGIPPAEVYDEPSPLGYQSPFDPDNGYKEKHWAKDLKADHIGGTMRPVQATPEFSPFYIGFEEYFGGYNFGTGNAQLDFLQMRFDWACG